MTHTYCDASWNTENQEDMREAVEQSAQVGAELCVVGKQRRLRPHGPPKPPSPPPRPTHIQANGVLTDTTLPDMLKPVVPGDEKGREGRTYWGRGWGGRRDVCREPQGGGDEGASRMVEASRLACLSPRRTSSGAGPAAWECGRQSPGFCRGPPQEAACSSSWPWPCCSRLNRSTFAVWDKREKSCSQPLTDSNAERKQGFVVSIKDNMEFSHS